MIFIKDPLSYKFQAGAAIDLTGAFTYEVCEATCESY
jgi:hypothetical protein